jgi:hypothetical protein
VVLEVLAVAELVHQGITEPKELMELRTQAAEAELPAIQQHVRAGQALLLFGIPYKRTLWNLPK